MTNVLSIIRKKTTYIYIAIISIIIIVLLLFFSFYNYYNKVINNMFAKNGYVYIISHDDYSNELKKYNDIDSIIDGVLLKPNFDDKFISPLPTTTDSKEESQEKILFWEELLPGGYDRIPVFDYDENLKKDEIIIYQNIIPHTDEEIEKIINNKITVYFHDELMSLKIKNVEKESKRGIKISKELFDELLAKEKLHVKKINVTNYYTAHKIVDDFDEKEKNIDYKASYEELYLGDDSDIVYSYREMIDTLNTASIVLIIVFIIIYAIVINNCLVDQSKNIKMKKILGYKNWKIKKDMIEVFLIINVISYLLGGLLASFITLILNALLNYNMQVVNPLFMLKLFGITSILSIVLILIFNIKQPSKGGVEYEV